MKREFGAIVISFFAIAGIFIGGLAVIGGRLYPAIGEIEMVVGFAVLAVVPVYLYTWIMGVQPAAAFAAFVGTLLTIGALLYLLGYIDDGAPITVIGFLLFLAGGVGWIITEIWIGNPSPASEH